jgi:hypothetical protein
MVRETSGEDDFLFERIRRTDAIDLRNSQIPRAVFADSLMIRNIDDLLNMVSHYPSLLNSDGYRSVIAELDALENQISDDRNKLNSAIIEYNGCLKRFPYMFVASRIGFEPFPLFSGIEQNAGGLVTPMAFRM